LILLDLNLPDRDGFSVIADLRRRHATISLVVLSASHDREHQGCARSPCCSCPAS
jgi:DNA-binding response OmpR family regulator